MNSSQSISLTFDGLNRLDTASGVWGSGNFDYDTLSNLTVKQLGSQNLSYSYDSTNKRLSTVTGGYSFSYDDRGNVINNGKRAFQFNRANQLVSSGTIGYQYDGHGRRVKKTGSSSGYSIYDLSGTLLLSDGPNGQTRYIHLGKELIAKVGSAAALEDKPGYTGHVEDKDLSLTYMQQRYYDPMIGRFYSNDPVGFSADNPMMFNRYAYANNNPYKFTDPDGRATVYTWNAGAAVDGKSAAGHASTLTKDGTYLSKFPSDNYSGHPYFRMWTSNSGHPHIIKTCGCTYLLVADSQTYASNVLYHPNGQLKSYSYGNVNYSGQPKQLFRTPTHY